MLYRQAGAAVGVAARIDESETLAGRLLADLARHALVVPAVLEGLAAGSTPRPRCKAHWHGSQVARRRSPPAGRAAGAAPAAPNISPAPQAGC